jgi:small subunit ribosomal protein S7
MLKRLSAENNQGVSMALKKVVPKILALPIPKLQLRQLHNKMSRKGNIRKRTTPVDPIYKNLLVSKLINKVMMSGKKTVASAHVYKAFEIIEKKLKKEPLEVFLTAVDNIRPRVEVRSRRVGGATYQVPSLVRGRRQESLVLRWLVNAARSRSNSEFHSFAEKLATEIIDAYNRAGGAMAKREEIEKVAEANTAFSHLRW